MKRIQMRLIALVTAAALLLSGCSGAKEYFRLMQTYLTGSVPVVRFDDMEYIRPDPGALMEYQAACVELAAEGSDFESLEENVWLLYDEYYNFYTQFSLADIHYSQDLTDLYWQEEYNWCLDASAEVDAAMDQMFFVMAASPFRDALEREDLFGEHFFDGYIGESVWDETFTALMDQEAELIGEYYALTAELMEWEYGSFYYDAVAQELADLYARLIALRQEQASYAGYSNYLGFAYAFYYDRDYRPTQEELYLSRVQEILVPLYRRVCTAGIGEVEYENVSEEEVFAYVEAAAGNMGGRVAEAFNLMEQGELYDIRYGENKYNASFEVFLLDYYQPFIFMNPTGTAYDKLTFAHEFGHFCNDYVSYGSQLNIDCMEVFSQGMEYLSLQYAPQTEQMVKLKMMDSLCTYVEQSAYASFEQEAYRLKGEELTGENLMALYKDVTNRFGFDIWENNSSDFVTVSHFFTDPMYVFSYVVSNDAAMQLYEMELEEPGAGLAVYQSNLDATAEGLLLFLQTAGLESPFNYNRLEEVKVLFEDILT